MIRVSSATKRIQPFAIACLVLTLFLANGGWIFADDSPFEIRGYRTIHGAKKSLRPNSIPARFVYGANRDWLRQPYRLAVLLVEFSDTKHAAIHTAAFYDELLFSKDKYLRTPGGEPSFGSVADWYRVQSVDRFVLSGKSFDWVTIDESFEAIHALKLSEAATHT